MLSRSKLKSVIKLLPLLQIRKLPVISLYHLGLSTSCQ